MAEEALAVDVSPEVYCHLLQRLSEETALCTSQAQVDAAVVRVARKVLRWELYGGAIEAAIATRRPVHLNVVWPGGSDG